MSNEKFKLEDYINSRFIVDDDMSIQEVDDLETARENFRRNARNLLQNFKKDFNNTDITFDSNIFNYFPIYLLANDDTYKFLDHIINIKNKQELVGNKFISNMKKISIDNISVNISDFYMNEPIISDFQNNLSDITQSYRFIVRKNLEKADTIIENFNKQIDDLKTNNNPSDLGRICSLTCDIFLQMMTYWVIAVVKVNRQTQLTLIEKIKKYLTDFENTVENFDINLTDSTKLDDYVNIFVEFLRSFNYCGEYINIASILIEEEQDSPDDFGLVPPEYQTKKGMSYKDFKQYKEIISEGKEIYEFKGKFENTQKAIEILQNNGVKASDINDLYDIKVYFRELYISNSKYKTKASTIIRKMTENNIEEFEKTSEYMFLREKITRGCFRELFPLELYHLKIDIQKHIYIILMKVMLCYDYQASLSFLNKLITDMTPLCFTLIDDRFESNGKNRVFK